LVKLQAKRWLSRKYFAFALTVTFRGVVKNSRISCAKVYVNIFLVYSTIVKYLLAKLRYLIQLVAHYCYQAVIDRRLRPGVSTWEVTLSARNVVQCVRWPATGITAHSL